MKKREYRDYLHDILDAVNDVNDFVEGMGFEQFEKDRKTLNAVVRSLEIIGEAAKNIPVDIREKYGRLPWKKMTGMGDKLFMPISESTLKRCGTPLRKIFRH